MGNVAFTRDEAILALDTLYSAGGRRLRPDDEEIIELSRLLNELPVIPLFRRGKIFRNCSGVCNQLNSFNRTFPHGKKDPNVGEIFYLIADEFCNNKKELGLISDAIKRNRFFLRILYLVVNTKTLTFLKAHLWNTFTNTLSVAIAGRLNARWFVMFANSTWLRYINLCHIALTSFICLCPSPSLM